MTVINLLGFEIDEILLIVGAVLVIAIVAVSLLSVYFYMKRDKGNPIKVENIIHLPVDPGSKVAAPGVLVQVSGRTDDELEWSRSDWADPDTKEAVTCSGDIRGKSPIPYYDADGLLNETWIDIDMGTHTILGVQDLVAKSEVRPDYLAADPRKVGGYLARQGQGALSALGQLLTWQTLPFIISIVIGSLVSGVLLGYFGLPPRIVPTTTVTH